MEKLRGASLNAHALACETREQTTARKATTAPVSQALLLQPQGETRALLLMNLLVLVLWLGSEAITSVVAQPQGQWEATLPMLPPSANDPIEVEISRLLATCNIQPGFPGAECDRENNGVGSDACYGACVKYVLPDSAC